MNQRKTYGEVQTRLLQILSLFLTSMAFYYIWGPATAEFHADCADTLYWAKASLDSGSLFNEQFHYACLLPFGGQLIFLPFLKIFGTTMLAYRLSMTTFALLFAVALWFFLRQMGMNRKWTMLSYSGLLGTIMMSAKLRELFLGHIIYYSLGILFLFIGLGCVFRVLRTDSKKVYCFLVIFTILASTNGLQAVIIYGLPVMGGLFLVLYFHPGPFFRPEHNIYFKPLYGVGCGTAVGLLLGGMLKKGYTQNYADAYANFSNMDQWKTHISTLLEHWSSLLGVDIYEGIPFASFDGIVAALHLVYAILLAVLPVVALFYYRQMKNTGEKIMLFVHWSVTALILFAYIFGGIGTVSWRLSPIVCTSFISSMIVCKFWYQNKRKRYGFTLIVGLCIMLMVNCLGIIRLPKTNVMEGVIHSLEKKDLKQGYATFWNAAPVHILSDSKVVTYSVDLDESGMVQKPEYQSNDKNYEESQYKQKYFLLVTKEEDLRLQQSYKEKATNCYTYGQYVIYIFEDFVLTP